MLELARPDDREVVESLARQLHTLHCQWRPDLFAEVQELYPPERFREAVANRQLYVARLADVVVGYVLLVTKTTEDPRTISRKIMVISEFCVAEPFRGHGIGHQMMEEVWALSRAFGCTDLQLNVFPQNDAAVGFWQKCGFAIQSIVMQRTV